MGKFFAILFLEIKMLRFTKKLLAILAILNTSYAFAYSQDTGKVGTIYTSLDGGISFTLVGGFVNAIATNQCPSNIGYAGNASASNVFKAALMTAKGSDLPITVTISGCEGSWFHVLDIYW